MITLSNYLAESILTESFSPEMKSVISRKALSSLGKDLSRDYGVNIQSLSFKEIEGVKIVKSSDFVSLRNLSKSYDQNIVVFAHDNKECLAIHIQGKSKWAYASWAPGKTILRDALLDYIKEHKIVATFVSDSLHMNGRSERRNKRYEREGRKEIGEHQGMGPTQWSKASKNQRNHSATQYKVYIHNITHGNEAYKKLKEAATECGYKLDAAFIDTDGRVDFGAKAVAKYAPEFYVDNWARGDFTKDHNPKVFIHTSGIGSLSIEEYEEYLKALNGGLTFAKLLTASLKDLPRIPKDEE